MFIKSIYRLAGQTAGVLFVVAATTLAPVNFAEAAGKAKTTAKASDSTAPTLARAKAAAPSAKYTALGTGAGDSTGSVAKAGPELDPNCARARKRLWVEGEGWVVRKVTTCY